MNKTYNVGKVGISGLIAQADTPLTLDNWFESSEDRTFIVKFSDYCAYMTTFGREGYSNIPFSRTHKVMEMLSVGQTDIDKDDALAVITDCYCTMIRDIGTLLIKESGLFARKDSDWKEFDIDVSLPVVFIDYFGIEDKISLDEVKSCEQFVDLTVLDSFDNLIKSDVLLNMLINRDDITLQDLMLTKGTPLEYILRKGITYLELSEKGIKGRVKVDEHE